MSVYVSIIGIIFFVTLLGGLWLMVIKREKELYLNCSKTQADLKVVEKLISHAKIHNKGKNIDEVIQTFRSLDIDYIPKRGY